VRDLARSLAFYRDGLGFPTHNYKPDEGIVFFALQGTWLALYPRDMLADDATVAEDGAGFTGVTLAHNTATKEDTDAVYAEALAAGGKPVKPPQDVSWGGYSGYFADPDGYLWEVAYNPFTDLS
jgi:hypothetical protein